MTNANEKLAEIQKILDLDLQTTQTIFALAKSTGLEDAALRSLAQTQAASLDAIARVIRT